VCEPCPVFASYTLAFVLQLRKKLGKPSVRIAEEGQLAFDIKTNYSFYPQLHVLYVLFSIGNFFLVVELERVQNGGRPLHTNSSGNRTSTEDRRFADIIKEKPLKVTIRVLVPVKEHPKVNTRPRCDYYWW